MSGAAAAMELADGQRQALEVLASPASEPHRSQATGAGPHQPARPMKPGRVGTMTHDDKRNSTTTLFSVLDVLTGVVIGKCRPDQRNTEFLTFLRTIDRLVPRGLAIHLILDNCGTHNHANVKAWLAKHPRVHMHVTPTSSSWPNLAGRWFGDLTGRAIRRGVVTSVPDLIAAVEAHLTCDNDGPKPFVWTAAAEQILAKARPGRVTLTNEHANRPDSTRGTSWNSLSTTSSPTPGWPGQRPGRRPARRRTSASRA